MGLFSSRSSSATPTLTPPAGTPADAPAKAGGTSLFVAAPAAAPAALTPVAPAPNAGHRMSAPTSNGGAAPPTAVQTDP